MRANKHLLVRLGGLLASLYISAVIAYSVCDSKSLWDSMWWAFMTFTTVGYGDQYPTSICGRFFGIALVMAAVFVVLPTMTALVSRYLIHDEHEFTHAEQEEIKALLRQIHAATTRPTSEPVSV